MELTQFDSFDWDEANLAHATRHGVSREEIEFTARRGLVVIAAHVRRSEWRYVGVGRTEAETLIDITFTIRGESFRAISVHRLNRDKRSQYEDL